MYEGMFSVIGLGFDADASTKTADGVNPTPVGYTSQRWS